MKLISTGKEKYLFRNVPGLQILLLLCCIFQFGSVLGQGNNSTYTLEVREVTLDQLFKRLETESGYQFRYTDDILKSNQQFSYNFIDRPLEDILKRISKDAGLSYMIDGKSVTLKFTERKNVKGKVSDAQGVPLYGVTVRLKGTTLGTTTDFDGLYNFKSIPSDGTLVFSYIGMKEEEQSIDGRAQVELMMTEESVAMDEVVVTALNITREEKSLGYSVSKVEGEELTKSVSGNWLNGMNGKVAGLFSAQAGTGPSGSIRVTLRGDQSLNYSNNTALFVVDGVPISSGMTATRSVSNYAQADAPIDYGDGASDLNPEDIAAVSVLKGPAAAALYGSRAANGAIIITTKSGRKNKGLGVTINSSVTFDKASYFPDFQTEYGNGSDMGAGEYSLWEISSDMAPDGIAVPRHYSRYTFGEKFDASKLRYLYASKDWDNDTYTKLPWVYQDDWYTGLFVTGVTYNNTVTISGNNGMGTSTRFSVTDFKNEWIMPNTGFDRQTVSLSFNTPINDKIKLTSNINYNHKKSDNMPGGGYDETNPMYALVWGFNVNSMDDWKNEYFEGRYNYANWAAMGENGQGLVFPSSGSFNPYRTLYEALNTQDKNRVFGNMRLSIDLMKNLTLDLRSGLDWSSDFRTQRKPFYTAGYENGFYREQTVGYYELNNDFMLRYTNNEWADKRFGFSAMLGGNNMTNKYHNTKITLSQLGEEGVYHTTNLPTGVNPDPYNYHSKKVVNSLYGLVSLSWDDTYFLDITGRNDWSSTLSEGNWSYFYPSVAASVLMDRVLNFRENANWVDMMKLRFSWANVGNDTSPYALDQYYGTTSYPGGYTLPGTIPDPLIQPENVESWEAGIETKLFKNRLSLDLTAYSSSTTNQIVSVDVDQITGATGMKINAGEISNKGIEVTAGITPVRTANFDWSFDLAWSMNKNKLVSLQEGWDPNEPLQTDMGTTIGNRTYIYSYVGEQMHVIYGRGFQKAPEGAYYVDEDGNQIDASGMDIVNSEGYPILDESPDRKIGNVNPDWRGGMTQRIRYKNFSLSAAFTAQMGGNAFSVTNFALSYQGKLKNSLEGRYDGLVHNGVNVVDNGDGTVSYTKNTTVTSNIQTYYNTYVWNRNNTEKNTFSTDFLKLKEVRLDYQVPAEVCAKTGVFKNASLGMYATNLFCITEFPQYDPETGMLNGSDIHMGIESMSFPMTRSYGFNVKLSF
ncbi:SusC/RagA family TonB-linked outer membrane protein [Robertkochia solimangrovi]|uniref:SusC/RagA family TonB-linked outer membrane protein n=1 Tax=Robertkochia solimangrovi TaxID=2213046 RepID=UPI00117E8C14|nr:SusC/RagA family TonB-linked outer membrane protein [Robertkochia solimangrovi]TRZ45715.1 SusC/RagA family TonB-linked outer membrane protein [Robertkochia solimangrovi]